MVNIDLYQKVESQDTELHSRSLVQFELIHYIDIAVF